MSDVLKPVESLLPLPSPVGFFIRSACIRLDFCPRERKTEHSHNYVAQPSFKCRHSMVLSSVYNHPRRQTSHSTVVKGSENTSMRESRTVTHPSANRALLCLKFEISTSREYHPATAVGHIEGSVLKS